jgi:hypothetical protein
MIPADQVDSKTEKMRIEAVKERITSTHHPGEGFGLFKKMPYYD